MGHPDPVVGVDQVAELRSLFRRRDRAARQLGLALLRAWSPADLDATGARAVLEAAGGSYPPIDGELTDPAELLAQLLWGAPQLVVPADVLRVYVVAGVRARRALVHLLARRGGVAGLAGLEVLIGEYADPDTVPDPTTPLLEPLLTHQDLDRVVALLIVQLARPAWRWHAADLLGRILRSNGVSRDRLDALCHELAAAVEQLVDRCDAAAGSDRRGGDPARDARETLAAMAALVARLDAEAPVGEAAAALERAVLRMLGSADPQVAALAAVQRVRSAAAIAPERLSLLARDPIARVTLFEGIGDSVESLRLHDPNYDELAIAEGHLVRFLSEVTELGRAPDEIEFVQHAPVGGPIDDNGADDQGAEGSGAGAATVQVFRFRMHAPHWSSARGWMIGATGAFTTTCYHAEDDATVAEHVEAMRISLEEWPDQRADGAA